MGSLSLPIMDWGNLGMANSASGVIQGYRILAPPFKRKMERRKLTRRLRRGGYSDAQVALMILKKFRFLLGKEDDSDWRGG